MKSNYSVALLVVAMSSNVFAGPRVSLLSTGAAFEYGTAHLTKMTPSAIAEFQNFRSYARKIQEGAYENEKQSARSLDEIRSLDAASRKLTSSLAFDRSLNILAPKKNAEGRNTALLQQMEVDSTGKMARSAFEIPSTHEKPTSISLTSPGSSGGGGVNEIVAVKRTFDMPNSADGKLELENVMVAKQLQDGKTYAMVLSTEVTTGNNVVQASIIGGRIDTREIDVWYRTKNPNDFRNDLHSASAHFKLPDEIKGEVVSVNINAIGTRLTFRTTEGIEYVYSIQKDTKKDPNSHNPFIFMQVSKTKLPGGVNSLLASVKIYPGRASAKEPVRGMEVESAAGVK